MSVTSTNKDTEALTFTLIADFDATAEQVWELWADPTKLEKWWGPPTYPATFDRYEFTVGENIKYYMTSPEGDKYHAWWRLESVNAPKSIELLDGFADKDGNPTDKMPSTKMRVEFTDHDGGTRMTMLSTFKSIEEMEQLIAMGMAEGIELAVGQMDALLAA